MYMTPCSQPPNAHISYFTLLLLLTTVQSRAVLYLHKVLDAWAVPLVMFAYNLYCSLETDIYANLLRNSSLLLKVKVYIHQYTLFCLLFPYIHGPV